MDHAQVVEDLPVKGSEVVGPLQAGDAGNELLLAEETHPDVVPKLRRFRQLAVGSRTILGLKKKFLLQKISFRKMAALLKNRLLELYSKLNNW